MKKVVLMLVFTLSIGLMSFTNEESTKEELISTNDVELTNLNFIDIICSRTCYSQGGVSLGCTEWECDGGSLDEIVIVAKR
jgi:hypothetical protein|tara:strand:- start:309 stop:551 length:243 start_codon:yes stop_codon:yes gene_type:complete